jgi:hypothetical protein
MCAVALGALDMRHLRQVLAITVVLAVLLQAGAALWFLPDYDPAPIAEAIRRLHPSEIAFVGRYEGEIGYLARLERPVASIDLSEAPGWLDQHPGGIVAARYETDDQIAAMAKLFSIPYRRNRLGIFGRACRPAPGKRGCEHCRAASLPRCAP